MELWLPSLMLVHVFDLKTTCPHKANDHAIERHEIAHHVLVHAENTTHTQKGFVHIWKVVRHTPFTYTTPYDHTPLDDTYPKGCMHENKTKHCQYCATLLRAIEAEKRRLVAKFFRNLRVHPVQQTKRTHNLL